MDETGNLSFRKEVFTFLTSRIVDPLSLFHFLSELNFLIHFQSFRRFLVRQLLLFVQIRLARVCFARRSRFSVLVAEKGIQANGKA